MPLEIFNKLRIFCTKSLKTNHATVTMINVHLLYFFNISSERKPFVYFK